MFDRLATTTSRAFFPMTIYGFEVFCCLLSEPGSIRDLRERMLEHIQGGLVEDHELDAFKRGLTV